MQLPFFYSALSGKPGDKLTMPEEGSKHIVSVLRMGIGDRLHLTDGKGLLMTATIVNDHKKRCEVEVTEVESQSPTKKSITIAISLLKNTSRFEWFLEKATEIGISSIIPLICERTEKQSFRMDRMQGVIESATLQSRQWWMPVLEEPVKFTTLLNRGLHGTKGLIAHCLEEEKALLAEKVKQEISPIQLLIGPEGDFTPAEIQSALKAGYEPVSLGNTRLRTETAGIVAAAVLKQFG